MNSVRTGAAYRIAVTYAAILVWAVVLLGAGVFYFADKEFREQRDAEISLELDRLSREPDRREVMRELHWRQDESANRHMSYALFDRKGHRLAGTLEIDRPPTGFMDLVLSSESGDYPVRAGAIDLADGSRLVATADARKIDGVKVLIIKTFVAVFAILLVISVAVGAILGWYLRRRLRPISATANAIVNGDIAWRVPVSTPGDEFDEAGRAVNLMLDRIAGLMENLRQVSSDIAHDLRKPLVSLLCETDRLGNVEGAEERVHRIGDEMLTLFASILRIAEIESGELERDFVSVDFSELMEEISESFAPALADAGDHFTWKIEPALSVLGNRELLAQLASNLLDNARIHTSPGTTITLSLELRAGAAVLSVEDNGIGVSDNDRKKLLQRFFRAEASRTKPGNGLGLNLVASIARAHRGSVEIMSANPGLRIDVALPDLNAVAEREQATDSHQKNILARLFKRPRVSPPA